MDRRAAGPTRGASAGGPDSPLPDARGQRGELVGDVLRRPGRTNGIPSMPRTTARVPASPGGRAARGIPPALRSGSSPARPPVPPEEPGGSGLDFPGPLGVGRRLPSPPRGRDVPGVLGSTLPGGGGGSGSLDDRFLHEVLRRRSDPGRLRRRSPRGGG